MAKVGGEVGGDLGGKFNNEVGGNLGNECGMIGSELRPCETWLQEGAAGEDGGDGLKTMSLTGKISLSSLRCSQNHKPHAENSIPNGWSHRWA